MIDLKADRAKFPAEMRAVEEARGRPPLDPGDPAFLSADVACVLLRGHSREEILTRLKAPLARRFRSVPRAILKRDLLDLVKRGLGNAFKRGNQEDPGKWITVELVATREGALVSIADEGEGFDVEAVVARFRDNQRYYDNKGEGMSRFEKSRSLVWWERGGRTINIRFQCQPDPGRSRGPATDGAPGAPAGEEALEVLLAAQAPYFRRNHLRIERCRVYAPDVDSARAAELRYVVECRREDGKGRKGGEAKSIALTGRALPRDVAASEFEIASALHRGDIRARSGVGIPRPFALLSEPSMVLYRFEPDDTLRERADGFTSLKRLARAVERLAIALRVLHASALPVTASEGVADEVARHRATAERLEPHLEPTGRAPRLRTCVERLESRAATLAPWEHVPIHGAFGWDLIVYDRNGKPHLWRFDQFRRSHPALDLGGFLADLLRFYVVRDGDRAEFYAEGRRSFMDAYFAGREFPWRDDMDWFVGCALFRRLERLLARPQKKWEPKVDGLLEQLERSLG